MKVQGEEKVPSKKGGMGMGRMIEMHNIYPYKYVLRSRKASIQNHNSLKVEVNRYIHGSTGVENKV